MFALLDEVYSHELLISSPHVTYGCDPVSVHLNFKSFNRYKLCTFLHIYIVVYFINCSHSPSLDKWRKECC